MLAPIEIDPKTFLREHCTLPALPEVVSQIENLSYEDNVNVDEVAEIISGEPALLAQVLKVINSAYYGLPRQVADVKFAVAYLGLAEIYRMVLSLSVINTLRIDERNELEKFWLHSLYTAYCARYLANKYEPLLPYEELWSAGMLHDIGKLVYLKFFPEHYKALTSFCKEHGCLFSEAEKQFSLPASAYLGTLLCHHWRLPDRITQACEFHTLKDLLESERSKPSDGFRRIICLANVLTVLSTEEVHNALKQEIVRVARRVLDRTDSQFLMLMGDIYGLRFEVDRFTDQLR